MKFILLWLIPSVSKTFLEFNLDSPLRLVHESRIFLAYIRAIRAYPGLTKDQRIPLLSSVAALNLEVPSLPYLIYISFTSTPGNLSILIFKSNSPVGDVEGSVGKSNPYFLFAATDPD